MNDLAAPSAPYFSQEQVSLIKSQIAKGATNDELALFLRTCERLRLDPFARQIFLVKRRQKDGDRWIEVATTQVSIDGFRVIAERTNTYEGQTEAQFCGSDGVWKSVYLGGELYAARVGVHRKNFREPMYAVARWDAFAQLNRDGAPSAMWAKMPDIMLAKCAEAQALRKAFPNDLSGVYSTDEMQQAGGDVIDVVPEAPEPKREPATDRSTPKVPKQLTVLTSGSELHDWLMAYGKQMPRDDASMSKLRKTAERLDVEWEMVTDVLAGMAT